MSIDNRHLWFRRHRYGYGWRPVSWEGWLAVGAYIGLAVVLRMLLTRHILNLPAFLACVIILTSTLVALCWFKGEKPSWRWGGK